MKILMDKNRQDKKVLELNVKIQYVMNEGEKLQTWFNGMQLAVFVCFQFYTFIAKLNSFNSSLEYSFLFPIHQKNVTGIYEN